MVEKVKNVKSMAEQAATDETQGREHLYDRDKYAKERREEKRARRIFYILLANNKDGIDEVVCTKATQQQILRAIGEMGYILSRNYTGGKILRCSLVEALGEGENEVHN